MRYKGEEPATGLGNSSCEANINADLMTRWVNLTYHVRKHSISPMPADGSATDKMVYRLELFKAKAKGIQRQIGSHGFHCFPICSTFLRLIIGRVPTGNLSKSALGDITFLLNNLFPK
jgi:hypothetical protein